MESNDLPPKPKPRPVQIIGLDGEINFSEAFEMEPIMQMYKAAPLPELDEEDFEGVSVFCKGCEEDTLLEDMHYLGVRLLCPPCYQLEAEEQE